MMKSEDLANMNVRYDDIFGNLLQQKEVTLMFAKLLQIIKTSMNEDIQDVVADHAYQRLDQLDPVFRSWDVEDVYYLLWY
jgi:hypothetical protein